MHFGNLNMFLLLWILPLIAGFYLYASYRRKRDLRIFIESGLLDRISMTADKTRRTWKAVLVILGAAFIIIALARPAWNPRSRTIERTGRDIIFILDVSRSMLAEDLAPNRLERAKFAISDMISTLKGDRVGLIVFSGSSVLKCPLTLDYGFFRYMLEDVSTGSVTRGGTMIGDAVRKALDEGFDDQEKKYKDIILITDGEDHDSFPVRAAEEAAQRGIRIIAIGLGNEDEGKRIPVRDENGNMTFLKYRGREVWTKLDATTLRKMANATEGGRYLNVATGTIDLGEVYNKLIAGEDKRKIEAKTIDMYEDKFQIFIAAALIFLTVELFIRERKRKKHENRQV
ncbi:MAG: VWA domain-containing protein [Candidatus Krumholzibacteriales bacterium]